MTDEKLDNEGFVKHPSEWNRDLARRLAAEAGVGELQEPHWNIIEYLRHHYLENKTLPVMKHVCRELMLEEGCVSRYFLNPEIAWHVAGLPDPGEEAKAYMDAAEQPS